MEGLEINPVSNGTLDFPVLRLYASKLPRQIVSMRSNKFSPKPVSVRLFVTFGLGLGPDLPPLSVNLCGSHVAGESDQSGNALLATSITDEMSAIGKFIH